MLKPGKHPSARTLHRRGPQAEPQRRAVNPVRGSPASRRKLQGLDSRALVELHDKQSERDHRELRIDKVGVRGLRFPIMAVSPGQAFGWSALVFPHQYTATALSLTRVRAIAIPTEAMLEMMRANPALGLAIMEKVASIVASRVRSLELALAGLLQKDR